MVPGQEMNEDNLGKSFLSSTQEWYVECKLSVFIRIALFRQF